MADLGVGLRGDDGFGVIGDTEAGGADHGDVIGAVADGDAGAELDAAGGGDVLQSGEFGIAVEDGFGDGAGEEGAVIEQDIGAMLIKAEGGGDAFGEEGETAGDEGGCGAMGTHRGDEFFGAGHEVGAPPGAFEGAEFEAAQHGDAFAQGGGEIDFAVHGAGGDGGDLVFDAGFGGDFIECFAGDDGAVHVGHEHGFAARAMFDDDGIDGFAVEGLLKHARVGCGHAGDIGGFTGRQPDRVAAFDGASHAFEEGAGEGCLVAGSDQGQNEAHDGEP